MITQIKNLNGDNKILFQDVIINNYYQVYAKGRLDDKIKIELVKQIKNIIAYDLDKIDMLVVKLGKENCPTSTFFFSQDMYDSEVISNSYSMLQSILNDKEYKISLSFGKIGD